MKHAVLALLIAAAACSTPTDIVRMSTGNPFGLLIAAPGLSVQQEAQLANDWGVKYFRPQSALSVEGWTGSCASCDIAKQLGLQLVLSVRATSGTPGSPPADLTSYRSGLGNLLDAVDPAVLAVENEENSALFYTGTPQEYGVELKAACEVSHARSIRCTNGGLVSALVAILTYYDYFDRGETTKANDYAQRAFSAAERQALGSAPVLAQLAKGRALLQQYQSANMDYLNFHWYIADPDALTESVAYLRRVSGLPAITNEIGQQDTSAATVTRLLTRVQELKLPIAVWYSVDSPQAFALTNDDGSLRSNGVAFRDFLGNLTAK